MNIKKIIVGTQIGTSNKMAEQAKQFMLENGYKMTTYGKNQAITDLEINDGYGYDVEAITALKMAIAALNLERNSK